MRRATRAACASEGVQVDLLESFSLSGDDSVASFAPALESGAWLGARWLTLLAKDEDRPRLVERLHALCEMCRPLGIGVLLEFTPRMCIRTFDDAATLVRQVGHPGLGIVADSLHMARTGAWDAAIAGLGSPLVRRAQVSDGPLTIDPEQGLYEAMSERQLPGAGQLPLAQMLQSIPDRIVIGIEVPQRAAMLAGVSAAERVRRAVDATRAVLSSLN
jgi:sugar phosphate isomerase/epimerase